METATPNTDVKVGTLHLTKPLGAAPLVSTQAATGFEGTVDIAAQAGTANSGVPQTSRFPARALEARALDAGDEGQASLDTMIEDFFSSDWAESARNEVRKHPLAVVGAALVAGLVVGRL